MFWVLILGITVFKIFIWGGILSDNLRRKFSFTAMCDGFFFVGSDLGPNFLQRLSANNTSR